MSVLGHNIHTDHAQPVMQGNSERRKLTGEGRRGEQRKKEDSLPGR